MKKLILLLTLLNVNLCFAQQDYYDVNACEGCGLRLWGGSSNWGITMANSSSFHYGPVTDYSIKTLMDNNGGTLPGRGWVWGSNGGAPVAAINTQGNMEIAGGFKSASLSLGTTTNSRLLALYDNSGTWYGFGIQSNQMRLQVGTTNARFSFFADDSNEVMTVKGNGNVGIGTTSPDSKLTVNGQIHATDVNVTTTVPTPDYVFEKNYQLLPLDQVESFIHDNKHLPEVPSAAEMEKKGINLSEMNLLLLKKVEELTLYMIETKKEIQKLNTELQELKKK